jgi:hypothetical protein
MLVSRLALRGSINAWSHWREPTARRPHEAGAVLSHGAKEDGPNDVVASLTGALRCWMMPRRSGMTPIRSLAGALLGVLIYGSDMTSRSRAVLSVPPCLAAHD